MKTREIVEYVLYPRFFNSLSILYKGVYCVSFRLYHISANQTITYAYPFLIPHSESYHTDDKHYEDSTLHCESNFSFETERFYVMYEEDTKKLQNQCVFRLEYQERKEYTTYLSCKLLKKITKEKNSEASLCTRRLTETKYEPLDTQIFLLNLPPHSYSHQRLFFRNSEFFSSVDLLIAVFTYGTKEFRTKQQLSNFFTGSDLARCNPKALLEDKISKKGMRQQIDPSFKFDSKDLANNIGLAYLQLQRVLDHYSQWYREVTNLRDRLSRFELKQKQLTPLKLQDLSYLNRGRILRESELCKVYETHSPAQTFVAILEEKEILRYNIRALRQHYCALLMHQSEQHFAQCIQRNYEEQEAIKVSKFIRFQPALSQNAGEELRNKAGSDYAKEIVFCPQKVQRIPVLLVEGYQQPSKDKSIVLSLTVFVHGYQGNSFDFQKAKNYLRRHNRFTYVLVAESITSQMDRSIEDLGKSVAGQVLRHVQNTHTHYSCINFVGFSLGGLIVRACLPYLNEYNRKLGLFISFSSPHLGISELQNNLVKLGIWFLIKVDKVKNLKQLNFQSVKLHDSLLMKLSNCDHISNFKRVVLVSSKDDGFVPLYSTILERSLCEKDILLLCDNLRKRIHRLERVEVLFNTQHGGTLDKLTGRRGHIEFLDNDYFLQLFFKLYGSYF